MNTKTWFITGTSTGLGRLMTEQLLARGDNVIATLRKPGALDDLLERYSKQLHVLLLDITDTAAIRRVVQQAFDHAGHIDVLVSNAGYGLFGAAEEVTDGQIARQIATNLTGSIQLIRTVLPCLRQQGGGRIIQVSSEGGQMAWPNFSLYHATKWDIEGFIESVAQEVAPFGIDFLIAEPGPTATNFASGLDIAPPMACYENTPAGEVRRGLADGSIAINGDAVKTVAAIVAAADAENPPFRLALGSKAYHSVREALNGRLQVLEATRAVALSADKEA
ncbi:short-chain dehydrogenase [Trabulsiella guamensis ATCC 49490]|uniref:Short-chain dehydrogenase n=1 Tax=Trabulsiella guamensis ATCC 49490 TaxID=1005994 RepID=A0A085AGC9_9ENTR|nr:SDR family oxidoreductase [Trabulsiella guamensis]KFC09274.1 short-chain dehydrogenase [Trabulsiella guamensis ATCC 49490]